MPPKQAIFVHHDQQGGRISRGSAKKAWAHIGSRSWQDGSRHLKIKMWKPQKGASVGPEDDQEISGEIISAASTAHSRYSYTRRNVMLLPGIASLQRAGTTEVVFVAVCEHSRRLNFCSSWQSPEQEIQLTRANHEINDFQFGLKPVLTKLTSTAVMCGVDSLKGRRFTQAFASFEYGARILQRTIDRRWLGGVDLVSSVLSGLVYAQMHGAPEVVQLYLKQIAALTAVEVGTDHPLHIFARNMRKLSLTPELALRILSADLESGWAGEPLILEDMYFQEMCEKLGDQYPIDEAERVYRSISDRGANTPWIYGRGVRYVSQFQTGSMAFVYLKHGKFAEAANMVSDAASDFSEWVDKGWKSTLPPTAPLSVIGMAWRITLLAQAQAGLGRHDAADRLFQLAIYAARENTEADHPSVVRALKAYSAYLAERERLDDAEAVEREVDEALKGYMLTGQD